MDKSSALKLEAKIKIREFEKNLILQVKKNRCLYDKNHPLYTNKIQREEVWRVISFILRKSVHECQNKWFNLRDIFRAYFRAVSKDKSLSVISSVKWIHYESLKFLIPHIKIVEDENSIYDENIRKQKPVTEKSCNEDLSDHSYTMAQKLGNDPSEEKNESDDHVEVKHEFIESDDLIIMDPLLLPPEVSQSSDNCTNSLKVKSNKEILEPPAKRKCITNDSEKMSFKTRMENKILVTKLKIMERECYLKDLEILKIENELDVKPSKYTEHFYKTIDS